MVQCGPNTHTHTHTHTHTRFARSLLPLLSSLTPIALARNTAPCFSWQNSAGCPCVPEKPANVHISHIFCLLSSSTSASSHHPGSQAMQDRVGQIRPLAYITSTSSLSLFLCLQSLPIIHSPSIQIPLSGGYLPFSICLSEPAECRCASVCLSAV